MRRRLAFAAVIAMVALVASLVSVVARPAPADAVTGSQFNPGYIVSDQVFYDAASLNAASAQSFIALKGASCVAGAEPCLKDYRVSYGAIASSAYCSSLPAASNQLASAMIVAIGQACGVSPEVLIVLLEKEQGLVTGTRLTASAYTYATGFACPDTAPCSAASSGFFKQVYAAAMQFRIYRAYPSSFNYVAGKTVNIPYSPTASCGSESVHIQNQATAGLYDYTPYVPNSAALANLTGVGNSCSSYGNRNFWYDYTTWFGSTTVTATDASLDGVSYLAGTNSILAYGWAFDGGNPTAATQVTVAVSGPSGPVGSTTVSATGVRTDVGRVYPAAGAAHGYAATVGVTTAGTYQVCVTAQWAAGSVLIGCSSVVVAAVSAASSYLTGSYDASQPVYSSAPPRLEEFGWTLDTSLPTTSSSVTLVEVGPTGAVSTTTAAATEARADINRVYPATGSSAHGFDTYLSAPSPGTYTICAIAEPAAPPAGSAAPSAGQSTLLGCKQTAYAAAHPDGSFDSAAAQFSADGASASIAVSGWSIDQGDPADPASVDLKVTAPNGAVTTQRLSATSARADLARVFPAAGPDHGFTTSIAVTQTGKYQVCASADAQPAFGAVSVALGCKTVAIGPSNAIGSYDAASLVTVGGTTEIGVYGWEFDNAAPTSTADMDVWVTKPDGSRVGFRVPADSARPDVGRVYPAAGPNHGLSYDAAAVGAPGVYQVCVWTDGLGYFGYPHASLGCKSVTVR